MADHLESEIMQKFRERVSRGNLRGIQLTYSVSGGMPTEGRIEEELRISDTGMAMTRSLTGRAIPQEASKTLDPSEIKHVFEQLAQDTSGLVSRSEARFLPDSIVGSITLDVDGEQTTLYFLADEEDRISQGKPIARSAADAISELARISQRLLGR